MYSSALKSWTTPAILLVKRVVSKRVSGERNDCPLLTPRQKVSTPMPAGVTTPTPVITASLDMEHFLFSVHICQHQSRLETTKTAASRDQDINWLFTGNIGNIVRS